ncbi:LRR domain containing protein [Parasponia andersonii]|uniref:LRR domain containing protein n=1 Tax=Parasponia andersonii TaxID=3476 RepID=A0A2P5AN20_PARAD|nr:LRR domain containing protein [Parasponia andersonii]
MILVHITKIPEEIGNLQLLEELSTQNAGLKGSILLSLFNMSSLKIMGLTVNTLVGSLPDNICQNLPVNQELYFSKNQLSGLIPSKLWQCTELLYLSMSFNSFTGSIPRSIGNLTQAMEIYLANNSLTGALPSSIGLGVPNLQELEVDLNY